MELLLTSSIARSLATLLCGAILTMAGCQGNDSAGETIDDTGTAATQPTTADQGVAVVELFTSEGCSSCPPAEAELARIVEQSRKSGRPIFALAFHVDYWNNLGWEDPFSSAAYSKRQSQYAEVLGLNQIYTPQMIVNGTTEFVGSNQTKANNAITSSLNAPASAKIEVSVMSVSGGDYRVSGKTAGAAEGDIINVAVVERGLSSAVKAGENSGRLLQDPNVVRWFHSDVVSKSGTFEMTVPSLPGVQLNRATVIVYAQRAKDLSVLGASSAIFIK